MSWIQVFQSAPCAREKLVCFSYAGGPTRLYHAWGERLGPEVEVGVVVLPGREQRYDEKPLSHLGDLIPALAEGVAGYLDRPFACYGHSLGALLAYELACYLRRLGRTGPTRLFVSARPAPQIPLPGPRITDLPDDRFAAEVQRRYGGIPPVIMRERALLALMLPVLRADLSVIETYGYRPEPPLPCPIHALAGAGDPICPEAQMAPWADRTSAGFDLAVFPGEHFFLNGAPPPVLTHVRSRMLPQQTSSSEVP